MKPGKEGQTKTCARCRRALPCDRQHFYPAKTRDGWSGYCRECHREYQKARYVPRSVPRDKLLRPDYTNLKARVQNHPYTEAVLSELRTHPHRANIWIVKLTGAPYGYVNSVRVKLERSGEIERVTYTEFEDGRWRRRLVQKRTENDPYRGISVVYFIREKGCSASLIKIGTSDNLMRRLAQFQQGSPVDLEILYAINGTAAYESDIHIAFQHLRVRGEWFRPEPDLLQFIEGLRARHPNVTTKGPD